MPQPAPGHPVPDETCSTAWSRTFPATPDRVPEARRFLAALLAGSALAADAVACLGELVNNAVIHSNSRLPGGVFTVRTEILPGRLRVEVHDNGGPWAPCHSSSDATAAGGRGLLIVAALASAWDKTPPATAPHRTVWFEMNQP